MFLNFRESQGSFQYGNYRREVEDLRSVLQHLRGVNREISAIIGHSKGIYERKTNVDFAFLNSRKNRALLFLSLNFVQVEMWCFCMQQSTRMYRLL